LAERSARLLPSIDSPVQALDQAVAWAIRRIGGHLPVDPAEAVTSAPWDDRDAQALVEDARRWQRVRGNDVLDATEFLSRLVGGLLGIRLDGLGGRLEIFPALPPDWKHFSARRLRAHRTLFDLDLRPRAEWLTIKLAIRFGPPVPVVLGSRIHSVSRTTVDEVPLVGPRAIFTASAEHEVGLYYGRE
jgi:hypothetical protein